MGGRRGKLISSEKRQMAIQSIATAVKQGARQELACNIMGITPRSHQNWRITGLEDQRQIGFIRLKRTLFHEEPLFSV